MISASEHTAVASDALPPVGGSDRQAAHYYRAQHARALEREERLKEKAHAAERIIHQTLEPEQLVCSCCGKVRPELSLREQSQEIGWEVRLVRRCRVRARYGPSCKCPQGRGIRTAPKPATPRRRGSIRPGGYPGITSRRCRPPIPVERRPLALTHSGMMGTLLPRSGARGVFTAPACLPKQHTRRHCLCKWWAQRDLNPRPSDYESPALTTELWAQQAYSE